MIQTKVTRMLTLAGFVPADKPDYANRLEQSCQTGQNLRECRSRSTPSQHCAGLPWLACAVAAMVIAPAQAQTAREVVLHNFAGPPRGASPVAGVIRDSAGNLYGTTEFGGSADAGVVYRLDTAGHQKVLFSFGGGNDGANPVAGVIGDSAGNLYGTTEFGGSANAGVVYRLDTAGHETVLYNFMGGDDGGGPYAGVIRDSAGNLYGTTLSGGRAGAGVVYQLDPAGKETVLYNFMGGIDGGEPFAGVIRDSAGNLYGTTFSGGASGQGMVYKLDPAGHETVLYSFTGGTDGGSPFAGVIRDSAGNLYGTTTNGNFTGCGACGVVYKLDPAGHETVLHTFGIGPDGWYPKAGVIRDSAGNLYGTTWYGSPDPGDWRGVQAGYSRPLYGVQFQLH